MYGIREIDIEGLRGLQDTGSCMLIDVRSDAEVARGMIEGAAHLPLHLLPMRVQAIRQDVPMVFYCQTGSRSAQACAFMISKGYGNVYNLRGGIMACSRTGMNLGQVA